MTIINQPIEAAEFLLSDSDSRSRSRETLAQGYSLGAGTVLGTITSTGRVGPYDSTANDGRQTPSGILYAATNATTADTACTVIDRNAEVLGACLTWAGEVGTDATDMLSALGIVVRK